MAADYGGVHSNGVTHMAVLGFGDGSYIELIATLEPGQRSPWWHEQIAGDAGPCGVAVCCDEVAAEVGRLKSLGVVVRGPIDMSRTTPTGATAEWTLAFVGEGEPGATLPFIIQDRTARAVRVQVSASMRDSEIAGVACAVLAVADFDAIVQRFRTVYDLPEPSVENDATFGTRTARWDEAMPYAIADAAGSEALRRRVARFGDGPCAFLLRSRDLAVTLRRRLVAARTSWCGLDAVWLNAGDGHAMQFGIIGEA
jgi:hypothetical protein